MSANRFHDPSSASARLFEQAQHLIPGGSSKANFQVKPHPLDVASGRGCRIADLDGVERLDAINNFTALVHGHAFPPVVQAVTEQVARGSAFAASTREEIELAQLLVERVPGVERIRFANPGTERVMMAIKAARLHGARPRRRRTHHRGRLAVPVRGDLEVAADLP
jgi:glutamate-1-semialdehyde 2,1-aminomutase